jgi:hypothetical protein
MQQAGCDHSLMARDDPEQRIAELERQLSDAKPAAGATAETKPAAPADSRRYSQRCFQQAANRKTRIQRRRS